MKSAPPGQGLVGVQTFQTFWVQLSFSIILKIESIPNVNMFCHNLPSARHSLTEFHCQTPVFAQAQ